MNQRGVSLLEVILVIALIGIVVGFVRPNLNNWRANATVKSDFDQLVATIDYLKSKVRSVGGTATLACNGSTNSLSYNVSSTAYGSVSSVPSAFSASEIVESSSSNILSGMSKPVSAICSSALRGVFLGNGQVALEGGAGQLIIELNVNNDKVNYSAFKVIVYQTTGFLQKQRWNNAVSGWVDFE